MKHGHRMFWTATLAAATTVIAGCGSPSESGDQATPKLAVVATTPEVADFVRNIGGADVAVTQILKPNVDPHDYEPTPADLQAIASAKIVVKSGVGLEEWLDRTIESAGFRGTVVDSSQGVTLREGGHHHEEEAHAEEKAHGEEETGAEEEAHAEEKAHGEEETGAEEKAHAEEEARAGEDQAGEDQAGGERRADEEAHAAEEHDPHIWHDPRNAKVMVTNIEKALAAADPAKAAAFAANLTGYAAQLDALDAENVAAWAKIPAADRKLVTNHDAFGYYIARYDLEFVGSVIPSLDTSAELSAKQLGDLVAKIKATGTKAIFAESSLPPKTAEAIGRQAGVKVVAGEDALFGDSLGEPGTPEGTYLGAQRHNTTTIVDALAG